MPTRVLTGAGSGLAFASLAAASCAAGVRPEPDSVWTAQVLWSSDAKVECVRVGDADPSSPGPEVVAVDEHGRVIVVRFPSETAEVVHEHGDRLTGLLVADVDPSVPGEEIYAGGYLRDGRGGAVVQIALGAGKPARSRTVFVGDAFVHAMGAIPAPTGGGSARLLVTDYAATLHLATPAPGDAPWPVRVLHVEPPTDAFEGNEMKDVAVGPVAGGTRAFVAVKSGRGLLVDADTGAVEAAHVEPGGIARAAIDPASGGLWLAGTAGGVVHLVPRDGSGFDATPVFRDAEGLRGVVVGSFPAAGGTAPVAVFGPSGVCHALLPSPARGGAWTAVPLHRAAGPGHWLAAADLVPGNGADELVLATYAGTVEMLVSSRGPGAEESPREGAEGAHR